MSKHEVCSRIVRHAWQSSRLLCGAATLCLLLVPVEARAGDDASPAAPDNAAARPLLPPDRDEFIPVPNIGGNSDIGVKLGVAGSYVRFRDGYYPYRFRLDAVLSTSFKIESQHFRFVQQYHTARIDYPEFLSRRLRLDARVDYLRAVDRNWFGVGNATTIDPAPPPPGATSANDYLAQEARMMAIFRIKTGLPFDVGVVTHTRYDYPDAYPNSKLAEDLASKTVIGGQSNLLQTFGAGIIIDTRDSEFVPRRGIFDRIGIAGTLGSAEDVRFFEAAVMLSEFVSLRRWLILGSRFIASLKAGNVPFYELQMGDVFDPQYLVGGSGGVRGVRLGRYAGLVKAIANTDLRFLPFPEFHAFRWNILAGTTIFFDAGRVWSDYSFNAPEDGKGLGIKYGVGAGIFFKFDEANLFRIDGAYSPDESGRTIPVSFYFESGFHF
jgi:outer membrane protein assembly factor BamA